MIRKFVGLLFTVWFVTSVSFAAALSLDQAKAQGLVGEQPNGYIGAVSSATPDVQSVISDVNARRKEKYAEIAERNGTPLPAVEALAGQKAIDKTPKGEFYQLPTGQWQRK